MLCFTADEEAGGHQGAEVLVERAPPTSSRACTEAVGEVGGFSTTVRDQRIYLIEAAEKGMAWMKLTARGTRRPRLDDQRRQRRHPARRCGRPDRRPRVAGAADPDDGGAARPRSPTSPAPRRRPDNAEALVEEFGGATRMLGAVISNTVNPTMLGAGYKVNVIPTEATAHVDGRFLPGYEDEFFATLASCCGDGVDVEFLSNQQPWETPYDGAWSTR